MPVINFKEIPLPTVGTTRDQFELFAREFLEFVGFKVIVGPDRGPDGGRDLVVQESRTGVAGETLVKWLVSCKHKVHSGSSVTPVDESDIHDRVHTHDCQGFLGFYSTIPSSGLTTKLNPTTLPFEVQIFDPEKIERYCLKSSSGIALAKRFFPKSIDRWIKEHPEPVKIFLQNPVIICKYCKKSLLLPQPHGIVVVWKKTGRRHIDKSVEHVYWCCKGECDEILKMKFDKKGFIDGWVDLPDLIIPTAYIRWVMTIFNKFHRGVTYSTSAFEDYKTLLLNLFPLICRELTEDERRRIEDLSDIPDFLGGWGFGLTLAPDPTP